ncbi:glycosyltransferase family 4 protein [Candidatus Latescibacterota bacterium]
MRILFFSHYFPPEGNAPAYRTFENCRRWVHNGHDVTVITCAPNVPNGILFKGYDNALFRRETVEGISVIRVWTFLAANRGTVRRILNYLSYMLCSTFFALFLRRPDIIIATSPQFFCGWAGVLSSRLRRIPFILEIRDIWPESILAVEAIHNGWIIRMLEWLEIKMYAAAQHIVTVGEGYRQRLMEKGFDSKDISVVMHGIDHDLFFPREPDQELKKELGLQGKFICSYVGTIGMACGLKVVLECAQLLKEEGNEKIVFLLVGDGAVREELEDEALLLCLNNVIFAGLQDKKMIPAFLSITSACLVHLRKRVLFQTVMPSKIFEAAGMGRPIINGVEGFASQIVEEAKCGICIEPDNADELLKALKHLLKYPEEAEEMGQSGYKYVSKRFDLNNLAREYERILEDSLATG